MEGVSDELAAPAVVTGVLRAEPDGTGQTEYSMKVSDVCMVAK